MKERERESERINEGRRSRRRSKNQGCCIPQAGTEWWTKTIDCRELELRERGSGDKVLIALCGVHCMYYECAWVCFSAFLLLYESVLNASGSSTLLLQVGIIAMWWKKKRKKSLALHLIYSAIFFFFSCQNTKLYFFCKHYLCKRTCCVNPTASERRT